MRHSTHCRLSPEEIAYIENLPTLGYWSRDNGLELKEITTRNDIEYATLIENAWIGLSKHKYHMVKVHKNSSNDYITLYGNHISFADFVKCSGK